MRGATYVKFAKAFPQRDSPSDAKEITQILVKFWLLFVALMAAWSKVVWSFAFSHLLLPPRRQPTKTKAHVQ